MSKLLRKRMVEELQSQLKDVTSLVMFDYHKMNTQQAYQLRRHLKAKNITMKVVKNTIAKLVFSKLFHNNMESLIQGPLSIAYGNDPIEVVKALLEWNKKEKAIQITGGYLPNRILTAQETEKLAKMPPRAVLLAKLAGSLQGVLQQVAVATKGPLQNMGYAFHAWLEKIEKEQANKPADKATTP